MVYLSKESETGDTLRRRRRRRPVAALALALFAAGAVEAAVVQYTVTRGFSIDDIQGGFYAGNTYAEDPTVLCGVPDGIAPACPPDAEQPMDFKFGGGGGTPSVLARLYPIDSEFGFYVTDFVGAAQKVRDDDYGEGWAANIPGLLGPVGLYVANNDTDTFKTKYPTGTWLAGLGANSVKASTEHYSVLEHVLSCFETLPYFYANAVTGAQGELIDPEDGVTVLGDCSTGDLDDALFLIKDGVVSTDPLLTDPDGTPGIPPNESTVLNDIAVSTDYGVTKKDDGKALYRFGSMVKRPNDLRIYTRIPLPADFKSNPYAQVTRAELHVRHTITNNPNDQIRAEDMENEGAKGRKPDHTILGDGSWVAPRDCYEGDGDFIEAGTYLRNMIGIQDPGNGDVPVATFSSDLVQLTTNAWHTTIQRDPFEWMYETSPGMYVGSLVPDATLGTLISGPRWRLLANKFGQDIPGLEIPSIECLEVPFTSDFIKYQVGAEVTTVINLLDWEDGPSPLSTAAGWIDATKNPNATCNVEPETPECLSVNGAPLTPDFDVVYYVKGDKKAVALYDATLLLEYDSSVTAPALELYGGTVFTGSTPTPVDKPAALSNPVMLIAGPASFIGWTPGVVRLNPTATGFDVRFQEWDYIDDGFHWPEEIPYLFAQPGRYSLPDGSVWEIGRFAVSGTGDFVPVGFTGGFLGTPKLFLTPQTTLGAAAITVRARNVSAVGFEAALFEQESDMASGHVGEWVAYLAVYNPSNAGSVYLNGAATNYSLQHLYVNHTWTPVPGTTAALFLQEEQSLDTEVAHWQPETVSILNLANMLFTQDVSTRGLDTHSIRRK